MRVSKYGGRRLLMNDTNDDLTPLDVAVNQVFDEMRCLKDFADRWLCMGIPPDEVFFEGVRKCLERVAAVMPEYTRLCAEKKQAKSSRTDHED